MPSFCFFSPLKNNFLMSCLKVLTHLVTLFQLIGYSMFLVQDRKWFFDQGSFVKWVGLKSVP